MRNAFGWLVVLLSLTVGLAACAPGTLGPLFSTPTPLSQPVETPRPLGKNPLVGTRWELEGMGPVGAEQPLSAKVHITLQFGKDGRVAGSSGCNRYSGPYTVKTGGSISLGPLGVTRMACLEEAVARLEHKYLSALDKVSTFSLEDDRLRLLYNDGRDALVFTPAKAIVGMPNPASVHCVKQGGRLEIRRESGGEVGYCVFPDGSECEEWAFFRGKCTPGGSSLLSWKTLANATYQSGWSNAGVVTLKDGEYREPAAPGSATELVVSLTDFYVFGDINGDGVDDAAVILVSDPGGSGTFYDLAVLLNKDGKLENVASKTLGDRIQVESMWLDAGDVVVQMLTHGPNDPLCCPSVEQTVRYHLQGNVLIGSNEHG
ncbi:MAG: META domain-containing protein [Anaerolineae bacterium]|nr:META domain-containing protein [Anaerolineae bacterium]